MSLCRYKMDMHESTFQKIDTERANKIFDAQAHQLMCSHN